jgi:hypothetical protein
MICFSKAFRWPRRRPPLQLRVPPFVVIITGCDEERIDADIGPDHRVRRMVVRTRTAATGMMSRR